jgi:hypothetical protein
MSDLRKLNSMTKYPSIYTFHTLGDRGRLTDEHREVDPDTRYTFTEKIDGTNVRIILMQKDYLIGSREELLHAKGDRVFNPQLGIVEHVREIAKSLVTQRLFDGAFVIYGELYGSNVTAASKNYTSKREPYFRVFDIAEFSSSLVSQVLQMPVEQIASWRDNGGTPFLNETAFHGWCGELCLTTAPSVVHQKGESLDTSHTGILDFLREVIPTTYVALDEHANGRPEGLIMRTPDRSFIAKLRFEDYERTLKGRR